MKPLLRKLALLVLGVTEAGPRTVAPQPSSQAASRAHHHGAGPDLHPRERRGPYFMCGWKA